MYPSNSFQKQKEYKIKQNLSTVLLLGVLGIIILSFTWDSVCCISDCVKNPIEIETRYIIHSCIACLSLWVQKFSEAGAVVDFTEKLCIVFAAANQLYLARRKGRKGRKVFPLISDTATTSCVVFLVIPKFICPQSFSHATMEHV
jgi:hypothetical protein